MNALAGHEIIALLPAASSLRRTEREVFLKMSSAAAFPCTVALTSYTDLLTLERVIRERLQCHGPMCSFLQSAEYKRMKFAITRALARRTAAAVSSLCSSTGHDNNDIARKLAAGEAEEDNDETEVELPIHIPNSQLIIYMSDDCTTVLIQSKASVYLDAPPPMAGSKRKPTKIRNPAEPPCCRPKKKGGQGKAIIVSDEEDEEDEEGEIHCGNEEDSGRTEASEPGGLECMQHARFVEIMQQRRRDLHDESAAHDDSA